MTASQVPGEKVATRATSGSERRLGAVARRCRSGCDWHGHTAASVRRCGSGSTCGLGWGATRAGDTGTADGGTTGATSAYGRDQRQQGTHGAAAVAVVASDGRATMYVTNNIVR